MPSKNKPGRRPTGLPRLNRYNICLSGETHSWLLALAQAEGITTSQWIARTILLTKMRQEESKK